MDIIENSLILTIILQTVLIVFSLILVYYFYSLYKISRSKNHLEASFDSIEEPLVAIGTDYTIRRANRSYSNLTGFDFSDLIGKQCYTVLKGRDSVCSDCKLRDTINTSKKTTIDFTTLERNDDDRILSLNFYPLIGAARPGAIEHIRDITELEKMRQKLEDRNTSLSDTNTNLILVQKEMDNELNLARQVQQNLLPQFTPPFPALTINHIYHPIKSVGGDIYDFIQIDDDKLGIFIGDVSGHGLSSAFVGTISKMSLYQHSKKNQSPVKLLEDINYDLMNNVKTVHYLTCFWSIFDRRDGSISYSRAGHPMPVVQSKDGNIYKLNSRGTFLGILDDAFIEERKFYFEKGDRCFLFTDGIYEVTNGSYKEDSELIGYSGFCEIIRETASLNIDGAIPYIRKKLKPFQYEDDYTLVAFEVNTDPTEPPLHGFSRHEDITIVQIYNREVFDIAKTKLEDYLKDRSILEEISTVILKRVNQLYTIMDMNSTQKDSWQLAYNLSEEEIKVAFSCSDPETFSDENVFSLNKDASSASFSSKLVG